MLCPKCKSDSVQVIDKRDVDPRIIKRRRKCEKCAYRFSTLEKIEPLKVMVQKSNGSLEDYDRQKVVRGIMIAAKDRVESERIEDLADEIERLIEKIGENIIPSTRIGKFAADKLRRCDEVAYLRFMSVYKNFKNIDSFKKELEKIEHNK